METNEKTVWNVNGQLNMAQDQGVVYATQYNNNSERNNELGCIIKNIEDDMKLLDENICESLQDVIDMVKEEFSKSQPKTNRLRSCITLISPIITAVNGIPTLGENIQRLKEFIEMYI